LISLFTKVLFIVLIILWILVLYLTLFKAHKDIFVDDQEREELIDYMKKYFSKKKRRKGK